MQALLKNPLSNTLVAQRCVLLMPFSLGEIFFPFMASPWGKNNQMIGTCNSPVARPLRDHLAGISLCWNKGNYILLFLCAGIMGLHPPISAAFQEPFMKSMIKCKWRFHQRGTRPWKLGAGNWLFALLTSLPQFCWMGEFIAEQSFP